jgi:CHAT domain-containing protein
MAVVEQRQGRDEDAEAHRSAAVGLIEKLRGNLGSLTEAKSSFLVSSLAIYHGYLELLLQRGKTAEAFAVAQQGKSRGLLDLLVSGRVPLSGRLSAEERQREQDLRQRAEYLNRAMVRESVENAPGATKRYEAAIQQLRQVEQELQTLTDALYARYPDLARQRAARTATLADVGRFLPADTALLEYVLIPEQELRLFVVTNTRGRVAVRSFRITAPAGALARQCAEFRAACADPDRAYRPLGRKLYALLVAPAKPLLAGKRRVIVCPDGPVWDVPFAALQPGGGADLLDRFEIAYAYSGTGTQAALAARTERRRAPATQSVLAFANPAFGSLERFGQLGILLTQEAAQHTTRPFDRSSRPFDRPSRPFDRPSRPITRPTRKAAGPSRPIDRPSRGIDRPSRSLGAPTAATSAPEPTTSEPAPLIRQAPPVAKPQSQPFVNTLARGGGIIPLPGTQREAEALRRTFQGTALYTDARAQEATAKQEAGGFRYVHLATHGFVNDAAPLLSNIVLAQPGKESREDGFLTAREIFDLKLKAEMVVLSACNTARGEARTGEGMIGLTWALFVAGAPTTVVSQWSVYDTSTARLMERFYTRLAGKKEGKGAALRGAALELRREKRYRHPYYWAPFVLFGAWE